MVLWSIFFLYGLKNCLDLPSAISLLTISGTLKSQHSYWWHELVNIACPILRSKFQHISLESDRPKTAKTAKNILREQMLRAIREQILITVWYGGKRGLVVRALRTCKQEVPGSSSPPCHWIDLSSVALNSTPASFVNRQQVCLLPAGIFNKFLLIYDICFHIYSVLN